MPEVTPIEPAPFSRSSPGEEAAYAALSLETRSALHLLLELSCDVSHSDAAAVVVVDGEIESTVATRGIAPYAVAKQGGIYSQLRDNQDPIVLGGAQLRKVGVQLPLASPWPQGLWQIRALHSRGNQLALLWVARNADRQYLPEELSAIDRCARLAERELTLLGRHKEIVVQRELATVEIAQFHEQLQRQHVLYRELAKHLPGTAVLIFDVDLRVRIREGWKALEWPYHGSDEVGHHVAEYFSHRDVSQIDSACRKAFERQRVTFEIQVAERTYDLSAGPLPDANGDVVFGILLVRDATEDRAERAQATATTARLEALVESLDDGILVEDGHLKVQLCSNRLRTLMQLDGAEENPDIFHDGHALMARLASICFIPEAFEESTTRLIEARTAQRNELIYLADMRIIERDYVPLVADARHIGHLWVYRDVTQRERTKDLLQQQADQLRALSLVDELTGLYNRRGFLTLATQQLKLCDRTMRPALIVFVDLDGMKRINDELGHEFGDQALIETANILRICMRYSDVIARLGGDEFVALAIDASSDTSESIEQRLHEGLAKTNSKPNRAFELQFSVGIAPYDPASAEMVEEVLARADSLMYEQKRARKTERK